MASLYAFNGRTHLMGKNQLCYPYNWLLHKFLIRKLLGSPKLMTHIAEQ